MNEDEATTLLNRLAERIEVGRVPLQDVLGAGQRARARRRRTTLVAVAASVALVLLGAIGARQALQPSRPVTAVAGPNVSVAPAPPHSRLVGIGHAAIAVPGGWGTNRFTCGKPTAPTVLIDQGPVPLCGTTLPQTVPDVRLQVSPDPPTSPDFATAKTITVNGASARRTALRCSQQGSYRLCTQALWIQQEQALFTITAPRARTVHRLLATVRVEQGYVAVPATYSPDANRDARTFTRAAEALGLQVGTRVVPGDGAPAGWIMHVDPAVGTVLRPGAVVHLTVSAGTGPGGGQVTASPGTASPGTASPGSGPSAVCAATPAAQRLVVTRSVLPGNGIRFSFPRRVTVSDPAAITRLVAALCGAPRMPRRGVYNCTFDNGLTYHVTAFAPGTTAWAVDIHASGCLTISGMGRSRWTTGDVWRALAAAMGVQPPTYRSLEGWPAGH